MDTDSKTATELLCSLLDSNGIEHTDAKYKITTRITIWSTDDAMFVFTDGPNNNGELHIEGCTPEQAIAATLGSGECENVAQYPTRDFECSACGCAVEGGDELGANIENGEWNFCPNCGKAVTL